MDKHLIKGHFGNDYLPFYQKYCGETHRAGKEFKARCPFHDDHSPSLNINPTNGLYWCPVCEAKGDIFDFYGEQKNLKGNFQAVLRGIAADFGIEGDTNEGKPKKQRGRIVAKYDYTDAAGNLLHQVVRDENKNFSQRRPDGRGGWIWDVEGVPRVPYRLPDVSKAQLICVAEGEKDCDNLQAHGFPSTTNPGGAGKWRIEHSDALAGKDVIIFPDNDEAGRKHASDVALRLHGKAKSIKIVDLPNLPLKGDLSDFIETFKGNTTAAADAIKTLMSKATNYNPPAEKPETAQDESQEKEKQADALIRIGKEAELFQAPDGTLWARFETNGHFETWQIRAKGSGFRRWLVNRFYIETESAPSATAVQAAVEVLEAEAQFGEKRKTREVFTRVGEHLGSIYLDLGDDSWRAVEISANGWDVVNNPPICFRRASGMLPLPEPARGGTLRLLDGFLNLGGEQDRRLILSWLIYTLVSLPLHFFFDLKNTFICA